jgi:Coenzyme PQQ synthesis protein D (PqqD)
MTEGTNMLSSSSFVAANEQQVAAKVMDGEAILINLSTGIYYSLGTTGGFIWSLVEKRPAIQDIVRSVVEHYDVSEAVALRDVLRLGEELCAEGLAITSTAGAADSELPKPGGARLPYDAPSMEKFTDMAEMFALDPPLPGLSQTAAGK